MSATIIRGVRKGELVKHLPDKLKILAKGLKHPQPTTVLFFPRHCVASRKLQRALEEITDGEPVICFAENLTVEALQLAAQRKLPVWRLKDIEQSDESQDLIDAIREAPKPTRKQVEQARTELAALMSEKLGRSLCNSEYKVICGWDSVLVTKGEMTDLIRDMSQQELLDYLAERGAGPGPVSLLNILATGRSSLQLGQEQLIDFMGPGGRESLAGFDFKVALEDFGQWVLNTFRGNSPGRKIRALYFALSEVKGGCVMRLSGANRYDREDADWACTSEWSPDSLFAPLGKKPTLWNGLRQAGQEPWVIAQAITIILVRAFFKTHDAEFVKLTGLKRLYIVSGFVDGDLYAVRTSLSPRA